MPSNSYDDIDSIPDHLTSLSPEATPEPYVALPATSSLVLPPSTTVPWSSNEIEKAWRGTLALEDPSERIVSEAEGRELFDRISRMAKGGGDTQVTVRSSSIGNIRWARNKPTTSGIVMARSVRISRIIDGKWSSSVTTLWDDTSLASAVSEIEQRLRAMPAEFFPKQQYSNPSLWSDKTYDVSPSDRSNTARESVETIAAQNLVSAGYIETDIETWGVFNTLGLSAYSAVSSGQFRISARHLSGNGSGWDGATNNDWGKIDAKRITKHVLETGLAAAKLRAVEPGRYTTVMHPEAVAAMLFHIAEVMDRKRAEDDPNSVFGLERGVSRIGTKVIDERLSLISDPMDSLTPFIPFDDDGFPLSATTWIDKGILKELSYSAGYARERFGADKPLIYPFSCRLNNNGPVVSIDDMILSTRRGIYLERIGVSRTVHQNSLQIRTVSLNCLWLIENGKLTYPIKNMHILESTMAMLNKVVAVGEPQRTWGKRYSDPRDNIPAMAVHSGLTPVTAPPLKVEDFNFAMLADAV